MENMKVKIIGAGSMGNHLAQAARRAGTFVTVVDKDVKALDRMRYDIYPKRYGKWDNEIKLVLPKNALFGGFDVICICTPPDVRMKLALEALEEKPKVLQLEKPLAAPFDPNLTEFIEKYQKQRDMIAIVGYDHAVAESIERVYHLLDEKIIGAPITIDVEFREHWEGIFKAHPWLKGPEDSYLGYWRKGGGAASEHSHALHLWRVLARKAGLGEWNKILPLFKVEKDGKTEYDSLAAFSIQTDKGFVGRVIQDVVTKPTRKWARIQGTTGFIEWLCNGHPDGDLIRFSNDCGDINEEIFAKTRPDDFYREMLHIQNIIFGKISPKNSPLALSEGIAVMRAIESAWSNQ